MIKKLLFEGVGLTNTISDSDIGNCRLRAAFHDDNGKAIFLEIYGHAITQFTDKALAKYGDIVGCVEISYYINTENPINDLWTDDISKVWQDKSKRYFTWTKAGIIELLKKLNTTVEEIEVDNTHAYKVFTEDEDVYSYGDLEQI